MPAPKEEAPVSSSGRGQRVGRVACASIGTFWVRAPARRSHRNRGQAALVGLAKRFSLFN